MIIQIENVGRSEFYTWLETNGFVNDMKMTYYDSGLPENGYTVMWHNGNDKRIFIKFSDLISEEFLCEIALKFDIKILKGAI